MKYMAILLFSLIINLTGYSQIISAIKSDNEHDTIPSVSTHIDTTYTYEGNKYRRGFTKNNVFYEEILDTNNRVTEIFTVSCYMRADTTLITFGNGKSRFIVSTLVETYNNGYHYQLKDGIIWKQKYLYEKPIGKPIRLKLRNYKTIYDYLP